MRFLILTLEAAFLVLLLGAAVLAWRLSQGPVTMGAVAPYVATVFDDVVPGYQFRVGSADLAWTGFNGAPQLAVKEVRVFNNAGAVIAALPSMEVRLSAAAMKRGAVTPEQIRLDGPIIRFVRRADGSIGLGVQGGPAPAAAPNTPADPASGNALAASLVAALTQPAGGDNLGGYLDRVAADNATIMLVDENSDRRWIVPDASAVFRRDKGDVQVEATFPVVEDGKRWAVNAKGRYTSADSTVKVDVDVDGFRPARVSGLAPQLEPLNMIDMRVSGKAQVVVALTNAAARLTSLTFDVTGQDGQFHMPAPLGQDYPVKSVVLKGEAGPDLDTMSISQFRLQLDRGNEPAPVINVTAQGKALNGAPVIDVDAVMPELSLAALKALWPVDIKPNTRSWIQDNLENGGVSDTRLKLRLAGPSMAEVDATEARLSAALHDLTVQYIKGMPKVEGTSGVMNIGPGEVAIDISSGYVPDAVSGKGLRVPSGRVRMYGLGGSAERADIKLNIAGGFGEVMRLIDYKPLGYASSMGLDANQAVGSADINLALDFPLVKDLKFDEIKIGVKANVDGVGIPNVAFGLPLMGGRMALTVDRQGMDVTGNASLGGIATAIVWRENFVGGEFRSRYELDPVVGNEQRPLVGLGVPPFTPPYIDGPVSAHVIYTVKRDNTRSLEAKVDLTTPVVAVPELGWRKEAGKPASAVVSATLTGDRLDAVPSFKVTSGDDFDVSGSVTFGADNKLKLLALNPSIVGETRGKGEVRVEHDGTYDVAFSGEAFNATRFFKTFSEGDDAAPKENSGEPAPTTPLKLRAAFDRMWLSKDGGAFTDVSLDFAQSTKGIQAVDFRSRIDGKTPFTFMLAPENGKRIFTGGSADGGGVLRAVGLFGDIQGGELKITGEVADDQAIKGTAEIKNFNLVGAPVIARLLLVATLTGIVDELRGEGISFKTLNVPFTYANSTLSIKDGEMYGNSLGLTGAGTYAFGKSAMDFEGTIIPAYAFNSALNSIPLLGPLLTGGEKGGGVVAATYSYRGDVATAQPSVNPLAVLTPGFLRHIFDIFKPGAPQEARRPANENDKADKTPKAAPQ